MVKREYITAVEAAKRLGVCPRTIRNAMKLGLYETHIITKRPLLIWVNDDLLRKGC